MKNFIKGIVTKVIDGETIEMDVTQICEENHRYYRGKERVHVERIKPFLFVKKNGHSWKPYLEAILMGKDVTCLIHSRNSDGKIKGDIFLL